MALTPSSRTQAWADFPWTVTLKARAPAWAATRLSSLGSMIIAPSAL